MVADKRLLIANRGEIATRIARAAAELGMETVAVAPEDDDVSLHTRRADRLVVLPGTGAAAYLDVDALIDAAVQSGCHAVHPGYGFLSESAVFAERCRERDIVFVGPAAETLRAFGDKARARGVARACGVPIVEGLSEAVDLQRVKEFFRSLGPKAAVAIKAVAGGGGRGIRVVNRFEDLESAFERCRSEALASFGSGELYVERLIPRARHVEVQIIGDGTGAVSHLWERECSLQRRHQKLVEIAPSPGLPPDVRASLLADALMLGESTGYLSLGTFEFLVWCPDQGEAQYAFLETNPRIQVEHTVTEEITGIDLVQAQLRIAFGETLESLSLRQPQISPPRGHAIQLRVNAERMKTDGRVLPSSGIIERFDPPSGRGVRVDAQGYAGYRLNPRYDSLLAKVVVHDGDAEFAPVVRRAARALAEFRISGVETNRDFLRAVLQRDEVADNAVHTRFLDDHWAELAAAAESMGAALHFDDGAASGSGEDDGGVVDADMARDEHPGTALVTPLQATLVSVAVSLGDAVPAGAEVAVLEAMKMEHAVVSPVAGVVVGIEAQVGRTYAEGVPLIWIEEGDVTAAAGAAESTLDPDFVRDDLREVLERVHATTDAARPDAVAKRRERGMRTARENIADLCDEGSFVEYGTLVIAAQRARRSFEDLARNTPADGIVTGIGSVNSELFGEERARCVVLAYDATVMAGTQGKEGHRKDTRMFELAEKMCLPMVFFTEGGGGRPGDTERPGENMSFHHICRLSGKVPTVGVAAGYCFAGNAAFLGACDVIVATQSANIGMGGPAMVEGGGLGTYAPEDIGPAAMHHRTGVIDLLVRDETQAVAVTKRYLAYFQGRLPAGEGEDQRLLRRVVPEDRRRAYEVRKVIDILADRGSVLELRAGSGAGVITALARLDGRPVGVVANNPLHLGGAIDADAADKAARFLQLCDAHGLPVVSLCDTPGIMVGPEAETTAIVRRSSRMLVVSANLRVPVFSIVLRKGYGLGLVAMMGGAYKAPLFTVAWPTGEFGGMGLEGAVHLGYRKEMEAIEDPEERQRFYDERLAKLYRQGKAIRNATTNDFDNVIDPAETRTWLIHGLNSAEVLRSRSDEPVYPFVSPW